MKNKYAVIVEGAIIAPSSSKSFYIDTAFIDNIQFLAQITTVGATGCTCELFYGFGPGDSDASGPLPCLIDSAPDGVKFGDTKNTVTLETPSAGQTKGTVFFINYVQQTIPRWLLVKFTNNDATNSATLSLYADL